MRLGVGIYIVLVVVLHVIPLVGGGLNTMSIGPVRADYLLHMVLFMPWMFLMFVRVRRGPVGLWVEGVKIGFGRALMWMGLGIGLAICAEGIQYWVPNRSFNPMDALFNSLGVLLGGVMVLLVFKKSS